MNIRFALAALAACGFALAATGCHHHLSYHDRVWNGWCGSGQCDSGCAAGCAQKASCCGKSGCGHFPLLAKLNNYSFCANGCGEAYVGEWISDPPDCCDPCDAYYGCYTGATDCCCKKTYDPLLWVLRKWHKHCTPPWGYHGIPSSGCYYVDCPCCYGCHPTLYAPCHCGKSCGKGCGKGCCEAGVIGDYAPMPDGAGPLPHQVDELPTPVIGDASDNRTASYSGETE